MCIYICVYIYIYIYIYIYTYIYIRIYIYIYIYIYFSKATHEKIPVCDVPKGALRTHCLAGSPYGAAWLLVEYSLRMRQC